jgi:hypothetical protein
MPPFFLKKGQMWDKDTYKWILRYKVKPWLTANFDQGTRFFFIQDGAPCHTANIIKDWAERHFHEFIGKDMWPPNSPDLNPLDYGLWAKVQQHACAYPHINKEDLKISIICAWEDLDWVFVSNTVRAFRPRLERVIAAEGGYID